ncbi:hypothetical protein PRUPE_2G097600 [Prunus persica]|uniref:CCHC-type domain-containing protein n=1 Tax=Prunus persica TaxID=3760 RepID=A0A251QDI8_PRUPE|nr:hypothetical protein PRUPE_2G097600 [Prunus persica]
MERKHQENEMTIRAEFVQEREFLLKELIDKKDRETMAMDTSHMSLETKQFWKLERRDVMRRRLFHDDGPSNTDWAVTTAAVDDSLCDAIICFLCWDGPIAGEKRARTQEMLDVGGLELDEPSPHLPPIPMSFKDKVSGYFGMAEDQLVFSDDDVVIQQRAIPSIQFSDKVKSSLYRPWRSAVIIKLMGRPLACTFLRSRLLQRWALKDMRYVLTGGPWQIAGQYIVTQKWKPRFNAKEEKITHMIAWVRINGLNVEYFRADVMEKIGNLVGATVKVDAHTLSQARGKFARICVEFDLAKPLTPFIEIEGRTYGVVYEGINLVCFECGCFGHGRDSCPIILQAKQQVPESDNADCMEDISTVQVNVNLGAATKEAEVPAKMHRKWMLLKPRNFRKNSTNDIGKGAELSKRNTKDTGLKAISPVFGSQFNVLIEEVAKKRIWRDLLLLRLVILVLKNRVLLPILILLRQKVLG